MSFKIIAGLAVLLSAALLFTVLAPADEEYTTVPPERILEQVKKGEAVLVDVREQREWDAGHLKDAVFIPLSSLQEWTRDGMSKQEKAALAKLLPEGKAVYCHCRSGGRALTAAEAFARLGHQVKPLKPGINALAKAGFPVAKGK